MVRCKITGCGHISRYGKAKYAIKFWDEYQICKCCYFELILYEPSLKLPNHSEYFRTHGRPCAVVGKVKSQLSRLEGNVFNS